jgi:hypothetical protein
MPGVRPNGWAPSRRWGAVVQWTPYRMGRRPAEPAAPSRWERVHRTVRGVRGGGRALLRRLRPLLITSPAEAPALAGTV